jgi:hypothetical protein
MEKLKVGDWVYYVGTYIPFQGAIGYVEKIDPFDCTVVFTVDPNGKNIFERRKMPISYLKPSKSMQPITEAAFKFLMDLALETRDFEWCKQLVEKFEGRANLIG